MPEIKALGASLVAISPQAPKYSLSMAEKHRLGFEVLSDAGNLVARPTAWSSPWPNPCAFSIRKH